MGGATFAYGAVILASPITSRLFDPKAFGLAALFTSGAGILGIIACLRYEMALVLPKDDEDAVPLFALCWIALAGMTALTAIATWMFGADILRLLNAEETTPYLWLFPVYVFLTAVEFPFRYWNTRHRRFGLVATGGVLKSVPVSISEIGGGVAGFVGGGHLIALRVFALIFSPMFLLWRLLRSDSRLIVKNITAERILKSAKEYAKFPLYDSWSALLNTASWNISIILLAAFFGPAVGGLYSKAVYLLYLPALIIGQSVGQVFLQQSAALKADGKNLAGLMEVVIHQMITLGTFPFALVIIIGPEIFHFFLGARWAESGIYARLLTPWLFMILISASIRTLFGTIQKQEINMISNVVLFGTRVISLVVGGMILKDVRLTLAIFTLPSALIIFWRCSYLMRAVALSRKSSLYHFMRCVAFSLPSILFIAAMKWGVGLGIAWLVVLGCVSSIPYAVLVLRHDPRLLGLFEKIWGKLRPAA